MTRTTKGNVTWLGTRSQNKTPATWSILVLDIVAASSSRYLDKDIRVTLSDTIVMDP
jgi:hypothetical protein